MSITAAACTKRIEQKRRVLSSKAARTGKTVGHVEQKADTDNETDGWRSIRTLSLTSRMDSARLNGQTAHV